jgi:hypothetical protein
MVAERYQFVEKVLDNVLRFTNYANTKQLNKQMLCEQMYWAIRRNLAEEIVDILEAGGDAYTKIGKINSLMKDTLGK